jgi:outer membrane protein TolC
MMSQRWFPEGLPFLAAGKILLPVLLSLLTVPAVVGAEPTPTPAPAAALTLDLAGCLHLALQQQPRVEARRASVTAAEDAQRALETLHVPGCLAPGLPVRRRQAALGVTAASAGLAQAESEAVYAVIRTYYTVVYAREQNLVANGVVERLSAIHDAVQRSLEAGDRDITSADVKRTLVYLRLAQTRKTQAAEGVQRALAALKEAVGAGPGVSLNVPGERLPEPEAQPRREEIVAAALARRGDLVQARIFAEAACLEVEAQGSSLAHRLETFASGSDIHSRPIPQEVRNSEYRPGALPPQMPTLLVGSRSERVKRAQSLSARAQAEVEVTRNLITLEAEDAFLRWEEAVAEARQAREAADTGDTLAADLNRDFTAHLKVKVDDVVNAQVLASQARSQYNEHRYRELLALADLERVTAGGFCAGLLEAPAPAKTAKAK